MAPFLQSSGPLPVIPRTVGIFGGLTIPLGLGLLRLSTQGRPDRATALRVIHAALDAGVRILDTADVYGLDENDLHFGEALAIEALRTWTGDHDSVRILTKVGLCRRGERWLPAGRPAQLRAAVDGSLRALGVDRLFLLQLHARDPNAPFEDTLSTLAELQRVGKVEHLGLCNVASAEIRQAQRYFSVAAVQNELSLLSRKSAENGVLQWAREAGIPFLAYRPMGGYAKAAQLNRSRIVQPIAERHRATPHQIALAALLQAGPHVIPLFGATRVASVESSLKALNIPLDVSDRIALDLKYSFAAKSEQASQSYVSLPMLSQVVNPPHRDSDIVMVMGVQGAGKSEHVSEMEKAGYSRLNRDLLGGKLDDLIPRLHALIRAGQRRVVLDNTYPTRVSRAPVIAAASAYGLPVRCVHLDTPLTEAFYNLALRMIQRYGRPLGPEEMKALTKSDPNLPPPPAVYRWANSFEKPDRDEGFADVQTIRFVRWPTTGNVKGLLLDVDGTLRRTRSGEIYPRSPEDVEILPRRHEVLKRWVAAGYRLFLVSNQSGIASGKLQPLAAAWAFQRTAQLLEVPIAEIVYCPHPSHPVSCYCRKPMPGLGVYLIDRHRLDPKELIMVGDMESDEAFAVGIGARYYHAEQFFG